MHVVQAPIVLSAVKQTELWKVNSKLLNVRYAMSCYTAESMANRSVSRSFARPRRSFDTEENCWYFRDSSEKSKDF